MKNIIITGGELFNKGAQSMTFVVVDEIKKRIPECQIFLMSPLDYPRKEQITNTYKFEIINKFDNRYAIAHNNLIKKLLYLITKKINITELKYIDNIYDNTIAQIDISGYALGSNWGKNEAEYYLSYIDFANAYNVPVYLLPQSFGPFNFSDQTINNHIRNTLSFCKKIYARENEGYIVLKEKYQLENVYQHCDIVLNNKSVNLNNVYQEKRMFNLPEIKNNSIAIIPNMQNLKYGNKEKILLVYRESIKLLLKNNYFIYLIRHSSVDIEICREIKNMFSNEKKVILLEDEYDCFEYSKFVGSFKFIIASRYHSIIHGYKEGIPSLLLGWAKKYIELAELFDQKQYVLDVRDELKIDVVLNKINLLLQNHNSDSEHIKCVIKKLQQENLFDEVLEDN